MNGRNSKKDRNKIVFILRLHRYVHVKGKSAIKISYESQIKFIYFFIYCSGGDFSATHTIMCKFSCRFNISSNPLTAILFFLRFDSSHTECQREKNMLFVIVEAKYCLLVDVKHFHIFSAHIILFSRKFAIFCSFSFFLDAKSGFEIELVDKRN